MRNALGKDATGGNATGRRALLASGLGSGAWLAGMAPGQMAWAALAAPASKPILTVSGLIRSTNQDTQAAFDRPMLEQLGLTTIETATPWYTGKTRFEGVLMSRLMDEVGAYGDRMTAFALNDYTTEIPVADFRRFPVILAMKRDGEYMPVRDKGPLFIVYPFDSDAELRSQKYYSRSAWQVARLNIT